MKFAVVPESPPNAGSALAQTPSIGDALVPFKDRDRILNLPAVVVKFTATWCKPCKNIHPTYVAAIKETKGAVVGVVVDVDEESDLSERYLVKCMPTFVFLSMGVEKNRVEGADAAKLTRCVTEFSTHICPQVESDAPTLPRTADDPAAGAGTLSAAGSCGDSAGCCEGSNSIGAPCCKPPAT